MGKRAELSIISHNPSFVKQKSKTFFEIILSRNLDSPNRKRYNKYVKRGKQNEED